ncbi:MAG: hypothetical protein Q8L81_15310, partial [Bacteroidota bacterium]|nr:hypothetical protein [Bacteroidota bacterium]
MKKTIFLWLFCFSAVITLSQNAALIDTVYDKEGRKFPINDIKINLDGIYGSEHFVAASATCAAGYFNVFFANGSGMEGSPTPSLNTLHLQRRAIVCQVLSNISGMVNPTFNSATAKVNILVDDISWSGYGVTSPSTSGVLGFATPYYALLNNLQNTHPGIGDNAVYKTITTQQDAYTNIASSFTLNGGNYFHGFMVFNFHNPSFNFNLNMASLAAFNQVDFYTVVLHEMTHALGFLSLINSNGYSKLVNAAGNYYARYDKFLKDKNNNYLLTSQSGCSNQYGLAFTSNTTYLAPACPNPTAYTTNSTTCGTANYYSSASLPKVPVYTSDCWEGGSSLSHFEDQCYPLFPASPYGNDAYFLMCNGGGYGVNKRHWVEEEKMVLCDIGYSPTNTYTSIALSAPFSYTSASCNNVDVVGINDGFIAPSTFTINTNVLTPVTISNILVNDVNASNITAVAYKCLEPIAGTGTLSNTFGSGSFTYTPQGSGLHVLRYIPIDASNREGNITYVYVNVAAAPNGTCNSVVNNPCNLIYNGDFENHVGFPGGYGGVGSNHVCGWKDAINSTADYFHGLGPIGSFVTPCTFAGYEFDNIPGNYAFVGTYVVPGTNTEPIYTQLTNSLLPNTAYNLSFDVSLADGFATAFPLQAYLSTNLSFTNNTQSGITIGSGILLQSPTTITNTSGWTPISLTFTTGPTAGHQYLVLGVMSATVTSTSLTPVPLAVGSCPYGPGWIFGPRAYYFLDNVKLIPAAYNATLSLPASVCATQSLNLTPLATPSTGVFSGLGVSCTGTNCAFNVTPTVLGPHYISYSLTAPTATCPYFANTIINVSNFAIFPSLTNTACLTSGGNASLTVASNQTTSSTYTWMPGSLTGSNVIVNPTVSTVYTVSGTNGGCVVTNTILVPVIGSNPITITGTPQICSGSYSSIFYLESFFGAGSPPGGLFTGPGIVMQSCPTGICSYITTFPSSSFPPGNYTYTYTASILNCSYSKTLTVQILPSINFTLNALNNSGCIASGQTATLTATPNQTTASTYTWMPGSLSGTLVTVSPTVTTVYTVTGSNGGCPTTKFFTVTISTPVPINFTNTPTTWCSAQSIFYLENFLAAGTPTGGTWSGFGGIFTASVGATAVYINPTTPVGTYTITYTYNTPSTTCNYSNSFTVNILQGFVVTTNGSSTYCSNIGVGAVISATASPSAGVNFTWSPGALTGATQTVTPGSPTIYTVVASNGQCTYNNVVSVNISTTCCQATNYMSGAPTTGTYTGSWAINQNVTINSPITFDNAEFKIAKDVTITIVNGGTLNLQYCHLYSCADMWSGIIVNNGGQVVSPGQVWNPNLGQVFDDNRVLIEDAKTAISMINCTNTSGSISNYNIIMQNTVFN